MRPPFFVSRAIRHCMAALRRAALAPGRLAPLSQQKYISDYFFCRSCLRSWSKQFAVPLFLYMSDWIDPTEGEVYATAIFDDARCVRQDAVDTVIDETCGAGHADDVA